MRGSTEGARCLWVLDHAAFCLGAQHLGRYGAAGTARDPARNSQA